jgi:Fe-S cluster biogenesis protein NfuA
MEKRFVSVYAETSPNPNSLKFVLNFNILENISLEYTSLEEASNSPLAQELFNKFDFVQGVFIAANFVTLTKDNETEWFEFNPEVRAFLKDYFEQGKPIVSNPEEAIKENEKNAPQEEDSDIVVKIKSLLDEYVRPAVEGDGGAISFHSFDEGVVKVQLQGACSGCPSSTITLKSGIENLLKRMIPEVTEVVAEGV